MGKGTYAKPDDPHLILGAFMVETTRSHKLSLYTNHRINKFDRKVTNQMKCSWKEVTYLAKEWQPVRRVIWAEYMFMCAHVHVCAEDFMFT